MFWILSIIFVLLNVFDIWLTSKALKMGAKELNPIVKKFGLYLPKLIVPICIVIAYFTAWWVLIIPVGLMVGLTIWNIKQYNKMEK
jgi:hypothetical protein